MSLVASGAAALDDDRPAGIEVRRLEDRGREYDFVHDRVAPDAALVPDREIRFKRSRTGAWSMRPTTSSRSTAVSASIRGPVHRLREAERALAAPPCLDGWEDLVRDISPRREQRGVDCGVLAAPVAGRCDQSLGTARRVPTKWPSRSGHERRKLLAR